MTMDAAWVKAQLIALAKDANPEFITYDKPKDLFIRQIMLAISYWMNVHIQVHLEKSIGFAMSSAKNGPGDAYICKTV